ncbi:MAG: lysylphosphatidylglycerol synthase transmembrane domain-containing protein [Paracoccaceae bacterium]
MKFLRALVIRWLIPILGGAVALAVMFYLYRDLDFDRFLAGVRSANLWWVAMLATTILFEQFISGWKWRQLLHDLKPISSLRLTGALLAGYGANVLVPIGISPLVRSWLIARLEGLKMATVLTTTIISRFIDGVVFALFAGVVAVAGQVPQIDGNLALGLTAAGTFNLVLFGGLLWAMFRFRVIFASDGLNLFRLFDWLTACVGGNGAKLRASLSHGVIWPRRVWRRIAVIAASFATKSVAATHFLWAGLAVGVRLQVFDYLFLMVFAGFAMILSRFIRVPGGFVIGSAFALQILGVPDEQALIMILFTQVMSILLVVIIGLTILWQSGVDIRTMAQNVERSDESA